MIAAIPLISSIVSSVTAGGAATGVNAAANVTANAAASNGDFTQMLAKVANDSVQSMKSAEAQAVQGVQGKADLQQVVQSVMGAQENLQTALAIRDKTVAAYQEITRMSI